MTQVAHGNNIFDTNQRIELLKQSYLGHSSMNISLVVMKSA